MTEKDLLIQDMRRENAELRARVPKWISVDDRLPEETGRYLTVKKRIAPDDFGGNRTDIVIIRFFCR